MAQDSRLAALSRRADSFEPAEAEMPMEGGSPLEDIVQQLEDYAGIAPPEERDRLMPLVAELREIAGGGKQEASALPEGEEELI